MRIQFILFFLLLTGLTLDIQAQPAFEKFLRSALEDSEVKMFDDQVQYLNSKPYKLFPLQRLEFRTESNQLDPNRQDYGIRISPSNPWELKNNNNYFKVYKKYLDVQKGIALKEIFYERYLLLADLLYYQEMQKIKQDESALMKSYVSVLEKQQLSGLFDDKDYVDLKLEQVERSVEEDEIGFEIKNILDKISTLDQATAHAEFTNAYQDAITPEILDRVLDSIVHSSHTPLIVQYYQQRYNLAQQEYFLEKNNFNFGFIQTSYQKYRIEQDRKPWSISLGVTIPIFNPNKGDMTKRKMDMFEEEQEQVEEQQQFDSRQAYYRQQLKTQLLQYAQTKEKIKDLKESSLASVLNTKYDHNPVMQIRFTQNIMKLDVIAVKLKQNIYLTYVELLYTLDLLQEQPLRNYLSKDLRLIQQ